jgi:Fe-S cluster biogenesis protein NfuA
LRLHLLSPFRRPTAPPVSRTECPAAIDSRTGGTVAPTTRSANVPVIAADANNEPAEALARLLTAMEEVRPAIRMDGGDIELVGFREGIVTVRLKGACRSCPMAEMTLQLGVERVLKSLVPEVDRVEAI